MNIDSSLSSHSEPLRARFHTTPPSPVRIPHIARLILFAPTWVVAASYTAVLIPVGAAAFLVYKGCAKAAEMRKGIYREDTHTAAVRTEKEKEAASSQTQTPRRSAMNEKICKWMQSKSCVIAFAPVLVVGWLNEKTIRGIEWSATQVRNLALKVKRLVTGEDKKIKKLQEEEDKKIKQLQQELLSHKPHEPGHLLKYAQSVKAYCKNLSKEQKKECMAKICEGMHSYFCENLKLTDELMPMSLEALNNGTVTEMLIECPELLPACRLILGTEPEGGGSLSPEGFDVLKEVLKTHPDARFLLPHGITPSIEQWEELLQAANDNTKWHAELYYNEYVEIANEIKASSSH